MNCFCVYQKYVTNTGRVDGCFPDPEAASYRCFSMQYMRHVHSVFQLVGSNHPQYRGVPLRCRSIPHFYRAGAAFVVQPLAEEYVLVKSNYWRNSSRSLWVSCPSRCTARAVGKAEIDSQLDFVESSTRITKSFAEKERSSTKSQNGASWTAQEETSKPAHCLAGFVSTNEKSEHSKPERRIFTIKTLSFLRRREGLQIRGHLDSPNLQARLPPC